MATDTQLKVNHLKKKYGDKNIVNDVSLSLSSGEIVGLLGPNGAGKTTSFYMIVGLVKVDGGDIFIDNSNITGFPIHKRALEGIGYLPQEASIFRDISVEANIYSALELQAIPKNRKGNILESLIDDFGLKSIRHEKGSVLSGGERRRVEIARLLALEPKFILLDEPFAGVDPLAVDDVKQIITILKTNGIGVLITDHNVRETLDIVDRAYIMNTGEIMAYGTPEEIIGNKEVRKFYLGEKFKY